MSRPLIPVSRPSLGPEELEAVSDVFKSRWLGMGAVTKQFEDAVSDFLGGEPRSQVIAVNTGTTALHLALDSLGIGPGDEVIVPSLTFAATVQAITALGATPIFCDVEADTLNLDIEDAAKCTTNKTKAIIPVHYRGLPCEMDDLIVLTKNRRIQIVEDAAHAFGSQYKGRRIGTFGDLTCFSFDPIKNITCGEGGAVVTRDKSLAEKLRRKRILGINKDTWSRYRNERSWFYDVAEQGYRYHLSNINAAIGLAQLKKFEAMNRHKIDIAQRYDQVFREIPTIQLLHTLYEGLALFTYMLRILDDERDALMAHLKEDGIDSGIHYIPVHQFSFFQPYANRPLPTTDMLYKQILTLPLFPEMNGEQVQQVTASMTRWASHSLA